MEQVNDSPRVLGNRYEVGELLGRGGMAEVHLGRDARLGRSVAIKMLRTDLARDPTFQARFRREAQSAAALNHPAIVAVYDTGEESLVESGGAVVNLPYIVMEHIEGRTLRDVLAEGHHLDVDSALDIITGVLTALEYSHRIGIVHRDIKPANVMLTPVGDVKVMDFGIARAMADASSTMTQTQAVIGTAQYLSPEQARGEQVDTRSDLYSAGCLLYELLTGRPPFVGDSPVAVAYQHVREQAIPPSRLVPGIPDSVDRIVLHSLAKGRDERYQSAYDFRSDVEAARGGRAVSAVAAVQGSNATTQFVPVPDVTGTRLTPAAGVAAGGLLGDTAGANGAGAYDPYGPGDEYVGRRQQRDQEPQSNRNALLIGLAVLVVIALAAFIAFQTFKGDSDKGGDTPGPSSTQTSLTMPPVVGQDEDTARQKLVKAGFTDANITIDTESSSAEDKDKVTRQDPEPGDGLDPDTKITLTVGTGPASVTVPNLKGLTQEEARTTLTDNGLVPGNVNTEDSSTVKAGRVTRSSPAGGDKVDPKTTVDIYIASSTVPVPDVIDLSEAKAKAKLKEAGFAVRTDTMVADDAPEGSVVQTDPAPRTRVKRGSTVTIFLATPAEPETTAPPTPTPSPTPSPTPTSLLGG
jgi:eukaryotic-like serine/threonine-protein kinase